MRILVVEDDESIAEFVEMALVPQGHEVIRAPNGEVALRMLEHAPVELVLLDMRMPVMDGWAFARAYRERGAAAAPIVVMTAAADAARRAEEIGCNAVLPKPFEIVDLYAVIARVADASNA